MFQVKSRVLKNEEVAKGYLRLFLECPEVAGRAVPGQFVMMRVGDSYDPLLRRPFSIHRINRSSEVQKFRSSEKSMLQPSAFSPQPSGIEILYKVVGKGTEMMAHIKAGEEVDLIGPLGRGFTFESDLKEAIIVGGGIGAAPMLALVEALRKSWELGVGSREKRRVTVFLGGRSKSDILCMNEFREFGAEVQIATDDGSLGYKGLVTDILEKGLSSHSQLPTPNALQIFSCGPHLMSKKVADISKKFNIPCQVSLEAHMACGVGACLGCVIKVRSQESGVRSNPIPSPTLPLKGREVFPLHQGEGQGEGRVGCGCDSDSVPCYTQLPETSYKRVCVEGPVFDAEEVVWE